jgi:defect in organelle trafficking protein DotC
MKMLKLSLLASLMLSTQVFAQSSFPGLNYPQPDVAKTKAAQSSSMDDLLSGRITSKENNKKSEVSELRKQAIVEIATALGSSGGLAHRMKERRIELDTVADDMDRTFDFTKVTIDNGVMAPVLTEGLSNYAQESDDQVRIADKIYKIEAPAKFVSVYPNWRTYLTFAFPTYDTPSSAYLPKDDGEKQIWDESVKKGWATGVRQADRIVEASFNRLVRDYQGMVKYKILLAQGLITPTVIAKQNLGVTGGGKEMAINDQVFRISDHSALNPAQKDWKVEYPISNNQDGVLK